MALVEPHVCGGGHVPELASRTPLMLAPAAVSTLTPNGSAPTTVTSPQSPSSGPGQQGSQLEMRAGSAEGRRGRRARGGTCRYLGKVLPRLCEQPPSGTPSGLLFPEGVCSCKVAWSVVLLSFPQVSKHRPANALQCQKMFPYLLEGCYLPKQWWPC